MPVPYNIGFELNILTKLNDDSLQIVEQILPFFQPSFNLTIDLVDSIGEKEILVLSWIVYLFKMTMRVIFQLEEH